VKVEFSASAKAALREISFYISRNNPKRAISFAAELRAKAIGIGNMPDGFPVVARYGTQEIRRRIVGNYGIFYRVDRKRVFIVQIRHAARDPKTLLSTDD